MAPEAGFREFPTKSLRKLAVSERSRRSPCRIKKPKSILCNIYKADCRSQFLKLLQQTYGPNIARLCGELDINAAQFFIKLSVLSEIQSSRELLSLETQRYVFEDGTNDVRKIVQVNIEQLSKQMKEIQTRICTGKRPFTTGRSFRRLDSSISEPMPVDDENNLSPSSSAADQASKRKRSNISHKNESTRSMVQCILLQRTYLFFSLDDATFSSSVYNQWSSTLVKELNDQEQLEHDTITTIQIDQFLMKYCGIQAIDTAKTKILLMHSFKSHEELLYGLMVYLRNKHGNRLMGKYRSRQSSHFVNKTRKIL
ncbi:unnamed protein product [Adineta ricciae]|uniref:Uncharacterized protein n=1 Tax=Adineta ricciae TaxID=249248 RepID=A0A813W8S7_ADIRI|nr:unnamed protein product [Adineta ricciae]CAF1322504.1 unnamed protein product [Adineta ricciae]